MEIIKKYRNYGYDVIINNFEPLLREYIKTEIFTKNFEVEWKDHIPKHVIQVIEDIRKINFSDFEDLDEFFEEVSLPNLREIMLKSENFLFAKGFVGEISRSKFSRLMNKLNILRIKIAHAKSSYSQVDFSTTIALLQELCQDEYSKALLNYLREETYTKAKGIPEGFFEDYDCQNNLPPEDYELEGGFVGREKEIEEIMNRIRSEQDRIITLIGAGGAGKTAIALKVAYTFLEDEEQLFEAIIWFSAKTSKLTDEGISPLDPQISSYQQLIEDIFKILDSFHFEVFKSDKIPLEFSVNHLNNLFSSQKCLLIIDNLETIYSQAEIINFIKNIPRPSCVLITSRKGLGEIERRISIGDLIEPDAIRLFTLVAEARDRSDLVNMDDSLKLNLVKRVKCYPLLIKWSIGQVCLGKDIDKAFSEIFAGDSEIAKFSFNDVFELLSEDSKKILYSMIIFGIKPITRYLIQHLSNLNDEQFEISIRELTLSALIYTETIQEGSSGKTEYNMLTLTRGFIESKLDEDQKTRIILITRHHDLSEQIKELEKSVSDYTQTFFKLGIKTPEEKVAVNYVKSAKVNIDNNDFDKAEEFFKKAIEIAPNLPYIWVEFSKFEYIRGHINQALDYAKKAVEFGPNNYLVWFRYGISLKKAKKLEEALPVLEKAKQLNPQYLPNYSELGRVLSLLGRYEDAEREFETALKEEKFPNFKQKMYTLLYQADNYRMWASGFRRREDYLGQIDPLKKAYITIKKALEIKPYHTFLIKIYRQICLDLGIALGYNRDENYSSYLVEAIKEIKSDYTTYKPSHTILANANYYLAFFGKKIGISNKYIVEYLKKGLNYCKKGSDLFEKITKLQKKENNSDTQLNSALKKHNLGIDLQEAFTLFENTIEEMSSKNEILDLAQIKVKMQKRNPIFEETKYGFSAFKKFVQQAIEQPKSPYKLFKYGNAWRLILK